MAENVRRVEAERIAAALSVVDLALVYRYHARWLFGDAVWSSCCSVRLCIRRVLEATHPLESWPWHHSSAALLWCSWRASWAVDRAEETDRLVLSFFLSDVRLRGLAHLARLMVTHRTSPGCPGVPTFDHESVGPVRWPHRFCRIVHDAPCFQAATLRALGGRWLHCCAV